MTINLDILSVRNKCTYYLHLIRHGAECFQEKGFNNSKNSFVLKSKSPMK